MKKIIEILGLILFSLGVFLLAHNWAEKIGLRTFSWEVFYDWIYGIVKYTMSLGIILLSMLVVFFPIYKYFDCSFNDMKEAWKQFSKTSKLWYALALFACLVVLFGLLQTS